MIRLIALLLLLAPVASRAEVVARWVQYAPAGQVLVRALTTGAACPSLTIDAAPRAMTPRFPTDTAFPVTLCEARLAPGPAAALVDGAPLRLPLAHPGRIAVLGDSGCRLLGHAMQACNDPAAFPLARVAQLLATFNPDLIIHVGDYYYREAACPPGNDGCAGSPHGDNWASWNADFFAQAQPLLAAAPLVLTRGNHESCGRGAQGWFRLLDPQPFDPAAAACTRGSAFDFSASYTVPIGGVTLLVHDSSFANDMAVDAGAVERYRADIARTLASITGPAIMVTHKPPYGLIASSGRDSSAVVSGGNATEQDLFAGGVPAPIRLLLAGHIHNFQTVSLGGNYAPQLVVGTGGTALDPVFVPDAPAGASFTLAGGPSATLLGAQDLADFGFVVMDPVEGGYQAQMYNLAGEPIKRCSVHLEAERLLTCQ